METLRFFTIFFFSWFVYAAFIGLGLSLYRTARAVSLLFLIVSVLIVVPVMITLVEQDFFATPGPINKLLSGLAFVGFGVTQWSLRYLPFRKNPAAFFICFSALCVCLFWGFVGTGFFLPLLFVPRGVLLISHVAFSAFFLAATTGSYWFFRHSWQRQEHEPVADNESAKPSRTRRPVRIIVKVLKITVLSYVFGLFLTIVFGRPTIRDQAVKSMELPEPLDHFVDITGGGLSSGRHHYSCSTYSFVPFLVGVWYRWEIEDKSHKPELTRGLDVQARYIWIPAVRAIRISKETHPFVFLTNGRRYEAIPK